MARTASREPRKAQPLVQSVGRALDILEALGGAESGLGVAELARRMGLKTPTVHNLLKTLVARGYAEQDAGTLRYRLGLGAFMLGRGRSRAEVVLSAAGAEVESLAERTGESASLASWQGSGASREFVFISTVDSRKELSARFRRGPGDAGSTACGMVMMAAMTAEELDDFLRARSRSARGGSMLRTPGKLRSFLDGVRREGAAALVKPDGVTAVAAPVTGTSGEVVAAIGVSAPSSRMGKAERKAVEGEVRASAEVISRRLGYG